MDTSDYLERAKHFRRAKEAAQDDFTRHYLEQMERSYRVLASSEAALVGRNKNSAPDLRTSETPQGSAGSE
jgi:hypothetical protein